MVLPSFSVFHEHLHTSGAPVKIIIDGVNYTEVIQIKDIVYMEASGRYTYVYVNFQRCENPFVRRLISESTNEI